MRFAFPAIPVTLNSMSFTRSILVALLAALTLTQSGCGGADEAQVVRTTSEHGTRASASTSSASYLVLITQLYLAYFGRPPDAGGLEFYMTQYRAANAPTDLNALANAYGGSAPIRALIDSFGSSQESQDLYGGDNSTFLNAVYLNLFNRLPDAAGKAFWLDLLNRQILTRATVAVQIMAGAQGSDSQIILNKTIVAQHFTSQLNTSAAIAAYSGMASNVVVRQMLARVGADTDPFAFQAEVSATLAVLLNPPVTPPPPPVASTQPLVAAGFYRAAVVDKDGVIGEWGKFDPPADGSPTLGRESVEGAADNSYSTPVRGPAFTPIQIEAGDSFVVALTANGQVIVWGKDFPYGVFGDGTLSETERGPSLVPGLSNIVAISANTYSVYALKSDGTVMAWGNNDYGQLGDGTTTNRSRPVQVLNLDNVASIHARGGNVLALLHDGTVKGWGYNGAGRLADGTSVNRLVPVVATKLGKVKAISNSGSPLALKEDGTVLAWGRNFSRLLTNPRAVLMRDDNPFPPEQVPGLSNVAAVFSGWNAYVRKDDGSVLQWGGGNETVHDVVPTYPVGIAITVNPSLYGARNIISGVDYKNYATFADGRVLAWGQYNVGVNENLSGVANPTALKPVRKPQYVKNVSVTPALYLGATGTLTAQSSAGLPVTFGPYSEYFCTVTGNTVKALRTGCTVSAYAAGNAEYAAAIPVHKNFLVSTSPPTNGGAGGGLTGTWCANVSGNQNCWVFDSETGSSTGKFYQQSINQYAGTLTQTVTWSANGSTLTYRFTRSTLTNSAYAYDEPITMTAVSFPYTLTSTSFRFQNIDFYRR